jgi:hypothetical protein
MGRMNWNRVQPTSIRHAMELCVQFGREKKNLSVDRIAEMMGLSGHHTLYKWLAEGRMPATLIRPFEIACGCTFLSRYIAHSAQLLTIAIPSGRRATPSDINLLQQHLADAVSTLIAHYNMPVDPEHCTAILMGTMEQLAWHAQPDLNLFETPDHRGESE